MYIHHNFKNVSSKIHSINDLLNFLLLHHTKTLFDILNSFYISHIQR